MKGMGLLEVYSSIFAGKKETKLTLQVSASFKSTSNVNNTCSINNIKLIFCQQNLNGLFHLDLGPFYD